MSEKCLQRLCGGRWQLSNQKRMPVGLVVVRWGATLGPAGAGAGSAGSAAWAAGAAAAVRATSGVAAGRR